MAINRIFLDLGPPKRYEWGPNTWDNIIYGQLSEPKIDVFDPKMAILTPNEQNKPSITVFL